MTDIRVYFDSAENVVRVDGAREFFPGSGALLASADPIRPADRIIVKYVGLIDQSNSVRQPLGPIGYEKILKQNGDPAGADVPSVVNYLNAQFVEGGNGGTKPVITSSLNIDALIGEHFTYVIAADNDPTSFDISTLGAYTIKHNNGMICGEVVSGAQTINITAANAFGADTDVLTITGIPSGGWTNTYSLRFRRTRDQKVIMGTGSELYFKEDEPFSLSFWTNEDRGGIIRRISEVDGSGYEVDQDSGRDIFFRLRDDSGGFIEVEAPSIPNNVWTSVAITYDGSGTAAGVSIYFDSVSQSLATHSDTLAGSITSTASFELGYTDDEDFSNAYLDEVAVYDKELLGAEVTTLYNSGAPDDLNTIGPTGNLAGYWRMGDGDIYPTVSDNSVNSNDGTMINMTITSIENNTP